MEAEEILKRIGYDNNGITSTERWIAKEVYKLAADDAGGWVAYNWDEPETRPILYGKYFVHRKDGKTHWETWNGSGWAYNGSVITFWMDIKSPLKYRKI